MKRFFYKFYRFSSSWTGTIIIVLFLIFFVAQSFIIPSGSMKRTLLIGDFLFAKKFAYGIPIPTLPWLELKLLPDFFGNGHLFEGKRPEREDIVIFRYPLDEKIHYVKRCVAVGGDEVIYADGKLLLHFHEGDDYIRSNYPPEKIKRINGKLWVENPYQEHYPGIQYKPEGMPIFEYMLHLYAYKRPIDMQPSFFEELDAPVYDLGYQKVNAFYRKIPQDHFYMVGDNRDNSNDSRIWGAIPYRLIVGKPWMIWLSVEFRSYETVLNGNASGNGRDRQALRRVCGNLELTSQACKKAWDKHRYSVRWGRVGKSIEALQEKEPILE